MQDLLKEYVEYKLSNYKILTKLSENKKSKIFLVQHVETNVIYVKKILINYDIEVYKEIQNIRSIYTPYIYEVLEYSGKLILIEEFINGSTLEKTLENISEPLSEIKTIEYIICLCNILEKLHSLKKPIIHRDIKPSNIIISNDDVLKLIDYDVARTYKIEENHDTVIMGTHEYAPPEQFGFSQTDCRSDIYSIGILMNFMTTKDYPKNKKNDGILKEVIEKCTKFLPNDRYQSVRELQEELKLKLNAYKEDSICRVNLSNMGLSKIEPLDLKENVDVFRNFFNKEIENYKYKPDNMTLKNFYKAIPGFRSGQTWKSIIACIWYIFLMLIVVIIFPTSKNISEDAMMFFMFIVLTILYTNFLNIRKHIPIINNLKIYIRILGYVLYTFIIIMITGALLNI